MSIQAIVEKAALFRKKAPGAARMIVEFDKWLSKEMSSNSGTLGSNAWLDDKTGFRIYVRLSMRMVGEPDITGQSHRKVCHVVDLANINIDEELQQKGIFSAFLDHVEKVILQRAPVTFPAGYRYSSGDGLNDGGPLTALDGILVESIENKNLYRFLSTKRGFVPKSVFEAKAFGQRDLIKMRKGV